MHKLQILISASAFVSTHSIHLLYASKKKDRYKETTLQSSKTTSKLEKSTEIQTFQQKSRLSFGRFNKN